MGIRVHPRRESDQYALQAVSYRRELSPLDTIGISRGLHSVRLPKQLASD